MTVLFNSVFRQVNMQFFILFDSLINNIQPTYNENLFLLSDIANISMYAKNSFMLPSFN